jgi:adenosylcobinamide amidohydrolase
MHPERHCRIEDGLELPFLVWRLLAPRRTISSAMLGGGIGPRSWVLNAQVRPGYDRLDPVDHLLELAERAGLTGSGVGLLTAADVDAQVTTADGDIQLVATVGVRVPTWAAAPAGAVDAIYPPEGAYTPGTINIVAFMPRPLTDGALVNLVATATEAKTQALLDLGVPGTGTATDAVCIVAPEGHADQPADGFDGVDGDGDVELFGGPRSLSGAALARAVHHAVTIGTGVSLVRPEADPVGEVER